MAHDLHNEATMFLVDDGDYSINCDYGAPNQTRLQAQLEAVESLSRFIGANHGESSYGLMTIGGTVRSRKDLTRDLSVALSKRRSEPSGSGVAQLIVGLLAASFALQSRGNRSQQSHIIAFICSNLEDSPEAIIQHLRRLKKAGVRVDIITMNRDDPVTDTKLKEIVAATQINHVTLTPGTENIADFVLRAGVIEGVNLMNADDGADGAFAGGLIPHDTEDDEMAAVIALSMQSYAADMARREAADAEGGPPAGQADRMDES